MGYPSHRSRDESVNFLGFLASILVLVALCGTLIRWQLFFDMNRSSQRSQMQSATDDLSCSSCHWFQRSAKHLQRLSVHKLESSNYRTGCDATHTLKKCVSTNESCAYRSLCESETLAFSPRQHRITCLLQRACLDFFHPSQVPSPTRFLHHEFKFECVLVIRNMSAASLLLRHGFPASAVGPLQIMVGFSGHPDHRHHNPY